METSPSHPSGGAAESFVSQFKGCSWVGSIRPIAMPPLRSLDLQIFPEQREGSARQTGLALLQTCQVADYGRLRGVSIHLEK
jgi:hypothetical protein